MKILRITVKSLLITAIMFYWTIARHEGSHALMARLEGAEIREIKLLPGIHKDLGFYFAYVNHAGETSWLTEAAPFFSDLLLMFIASAFLYWKRGTRYYNALLLLGFISPIIDLVYNYQGGLWREGTDVSDLLVHVPEAFVHIAFVTSILGANCALVFFRKRRINLQKGLSG